MAKKSKNHAAHKNLVKDLSAVIDDHGLHDTLSIKAMDLVEVDCPNGQTPHEITFTDENGVQHHKTVCA
jgi:hypothetical protein